LSKFTEGRSYPEQYKELFLIRFKGKLSSWSWIHRRSQLLGIQR